MPKYNSSNAPFQPGDMCDRYRIVGFLGAGGMGVVYEAVHRSLGKHVALKALHGLTSEDPKRVEVEAKALAMFEHRHIVRVFDGGATPEGSPWFVMERLRGVTLRGVICGKGKQPIATVIRYGVQIAAACAVVHEQGVVHRDIKPENIFVTSPDDEVRILDFGLAKWEGRNIQSTGNLRVLGSLPYLAPERAQAEPGGALSDVYSFGVVLYELATGRHPFESSVDMRCAHVKEVPTSVSKLRPDVPPALEDLIHQMLEKPPSARPQMVEVLHRIRHLETATEYEGWSSGTWVRSDTDWTDSLGPGEYNLPQTAQMILGAVRFVAASNNSSTEELLARVLLGRGVGTTMLVANACLATLNTSAEDKVWAQQYLRSWALADPAGRAEVGRQLMAISTSMARQYPADFQSDDRWLVRVALGAASFVPYNNRDHEAVHALFKLVSLNADDCRLAESALLLLTRVDTEEREAVVEALKLLANQCEAGRVQLGILLHDRISSMSPMRSYANG